MYGVVPFEQAAKAKGIRPIFGCHLDDRESHVVLLARNRTGYETICRLVSRRRLDGDAFVLLNALQVLHDGIHVLVEDVRLAEKLRDCIPHRHLWFELVRPGRPAIHEQQMFSASQRLGIPLVASTDTYFCDEKDQPTHRLLTAIRMGTTLDRLNAGAVAAPGQRLYTPEGNRSRVGGK